MKQYTLRNAPTFILTGELLSCRHDEKLLVNELRQRQVVSLCNRSHRATVCRLKAQGRWIGQTNEFGNNGEAS
ncbi:hypothetical protein [Methylogaea oryzae]|uniref:Uncharacterized protein n=1 Tax=Methylogaea oryzae TaxID=1295382 RepID=A0A8D5AJ68_9GAMM|nr:hypothetical protein [Methylogaea oryzae]BBL69736.1 hypothetical protein MoryE10_03420 [Methylogaea oryzae]